MYIQPINSKYIHFIDNNITVEVKPWYRRVSKWEVDRKVESWNKAWLIAGGDLRDMGVNVSEEDMCNFFNIGEDPGLQTFISKTRQPDGGIVFEAYISEQ